MLLNVVLLEDDPDLRSELVFCLAHNGFRCSSASGMTEFWPLLEKALPCLVLLDIGLPDGNGLEVARHLAGREDVGVVMLTGRSGMGDRVRGLDNGADAYLAKPVDHGELIATLRAVGRRLSFDNDRPWLTADDSWTLLAPTGERHALTETERVIVRTLLLSEGRAVPREALIVALGRDPLEYDPHSLEAIINRLRKKLGDAFPLRTVRGRGYALGGVRDAG